MFLLRKFMGNDNRNSKLFDKYKKVRIVTNNLKTFKKMENELLDY